MISTQAGSGSGKRYENISVEMQSSEKSEAFDR